MLFLYAIGFVLKNRWKVTQKQVGCVYICYVKRGKSSGLMRKSFSVKSVGRHFPWKQRHNDEILKLSR